MLLENIFIISVLKCLNKINSERRPDQHSVHPNPRVTHTDMHAYKGTQAHTQEGNSTTERVQWTPNVGGKGETETRTENKK